MGKKKFKNVILSKDHDVIGTMIDELHHDFMRVNEKAENMDNYEMFWDFHKGIKLDQFLDDEEEEDHDEHYEKLWIHCQTLCSRQQR